MNMIVRKWFSKFVQMPILVLVRALVHTQREILYRDYREGNKAECSKQYQEQTTQRDAHCVL
jgi:hypothetical protein